jgi:PhoPQ-activated pathogenicity-related protein
MQPARVVLLICALAPLAHGGDYTALDRYVAAPDASYRYTLLHTVNSPGLVAYQIDLVSQTWLTTAQVDRPEWHHWVTIYKPDQLTTSTAVLFINGGSNTTSPATPDPLMILLAATAGAVVVDLGQVPNEPLKFAGESQSRTEDSFIAYTWDKYLRTGDERWPARLPMTKAAVRAMDAVTDFLGKLQTGAMTVKNFVVAGGSKRGWTTWSVAQVDPRVIGVAPIVFDALNLPAAFESQWQAYGHWAPAVQDYVDLGIMNWFGTPQMAALQEIEDPYQYRERLALPSYQMASTGDQFFLPDSPRFFFSDLPGEKYLRFVPNTDHGMSSNSLTTATNLVAWFRAVSQNFPRPRFYWHADRSAGTLTVRTVDTPSQAMLWQASNPTKRDFRLETIGPAWTSTPLSATNGIYTATVTAAQGWSAFFVELTFPGPGTPPNDIPLVFTTEVVVTPDTYPFQPPPGWGTTAPTRPKAPPHR